ncbi:MAG: NADP-dependent phosphogluconate dehydrogenase [Bryobacter sp.]|nr:NADP-dependent phosphogluconate dehydrogenase [Bryobacter sp.]
MAQYDIGMIGLGVMGQNLALNMESKGFSVATFYRKDDKAQAAAELFKGKNLGIFRTYQDMVAALKTPRKILLMVTAGKAVDEVIQELKPMLAKDDILIDGGNSFFPDTDRRTKELEAAGLQYIGTGVSGGEEGALKGPAIMPGGHEAAYKEVEPIFNRIAAQVNDGPCSGYIGKGGAGHYVKMVHNGIEYGIMQLLSETYDIMKNGLGMTVPEMHEVFTKWNAGDLNSYLIEISAGVTSKNDPETGKPVVEIILDTAGQKGTGKWTSQNALDLGVAIPTINASLEGRILSAIKNERVAAAKILTGVNKKFDIGKAEAIQLLHDALKLAILTSYAQGFALMREASKEYGYNLNFREVARIWKGGCIIRATVLDDFRAAFAENPELANLLVAPKFAKLANELNGALRKIVALSVEAGIPVLGFNSSLGYYDSYRQARLPQNFLQGLRDYFGAHTYERIDKPRGQFFHTHWID